jgi:hypothetical protein
MEIFVEASKGWGYALFYTAFFVVVVFPAAILVVTPPYFAYGIEYLLRIKDEAINKTIRIICYMVSFLWWFMFFGVCFLGMYNES